MNAATIGTLDIELYRTILEFLDYGSFLRMTMADPRLYRMRFSELSDILRKLEKRDAVIKINISTFFHCINIRVAKSHLQLRMIYTEKTVNEILNSIANEEEKIYSDGCNVVEIIKPENVKVCVRTSQSGMYFEGNNFAKILMSVLKLMRMTKLRLIRTGYNDNWYVTLTKDGTTHLVKEHAQYNLMNEYVLM